MQFHEKKFFDLFDFTKEFKRKEGAILGKILLFAKKTVKIDILFSRFSENS